MGEPVLANDVFGDLRIAPLPDGTKVRAAFILVQLDDGDWCARSVGDEYDRVTFLGALTSYTHALRQDEAVGWFEDNDTNS
ncbi:MAG: hypothetical protein JWL64_1649 [Frankiales bacterium]|nr:hypothetical protein [Frankiales bacterium]